LFIVHRVAPSEEILCRLLAYGDKLGLCEEMISIVVDLSIVVSSAW
jgi:hypothetical protein